MHTRHIEIQLKKYFHTYKETKPSKHKFSKTVSTKYFTIPILLRPATEIFGIEILEFLFNWRKKKGKYQRYKTLLYFTYYEAVKLRHNFFSTYSFIYRKYFFHCDILKIIQMLSNLFLELLKYKPPISKDISLNTIQWLNIRKTCDFFVLWGEEK